MKDQIKQRIKNLKDEVNTLEKQWDKLDSNGPWNQQNIITNKMVELSKEIEELERLLNLLNDITK